MSESKFRDAFLKATEAGPSVDPLIARYGDTFQVYKDASEKLSAHFGMSTSDALLIILFGGLLSEIRAIRTPIEEFVAMTREMHPKQSALVDQLKRELGTDEDWRQ